MKKVLLCVLCCVFFGFTGISAHAALIISGYVSPNIDFSRTFLMFNSVDDQIQGWDLITRFQPISANTTSYFNVAPSDYISEEQLFGTQWYTVLALSQVGDTKGVTIGSNSIAAGNSWNSYFPSVQESVLIQNLEAWYTPESASFIRNFIYDNLFPIHGAEWDQNQGVNLYNFTPNAGPAGTAFASSVPIPSAVWFLGSGLVGLLGIVRRFK